jgi:hypothetical protein
MPAAPTGRATKPTPVASDAAIATAGSKEKDPKLLKGHRQLWAFFRYEAFPLAKCQYKMAGKPSVGEVSYMRIARSVAIAMTVTIIWIIPISAAAQAPDLSGIWTNATLTPFERPREFSGKEFFTREEAAAFEREARERNNGDRRDVNADADLAVGYNDFWWDRGTKVASTLRTSIIVDPADGRLPALTPDAQKKAAARAEARRLHPADGPENLTLADRCIARPGPPIVPVGYNNNHRIVQTQEYVLIFSEMMHDARIIPIGVHPHLPGNVRQWFGDSRGHWEGKTLVVETTNFTDKTNFRGSGKNMRLIERFTRVDPDTLLYQFTVNDPESFERPWSGEIPMKKTAGPIFEYACHEGNYSMLNTLTAARAEEALRSTR